jgi:diaminopimelate epimerase
MLRGVVDRHVTVELRGGALTIGWEDAASPVMMTGPAAEVFRGNFPIPEG